MLNLAHWRLMVAVADLGSISRAAERVGITQSGASQAIAQLEATLGLQVFARSRQELHITALGEPVIDHARAMLAQLEAIRALADTSRGLSQGRIRLGSFPSVISIYLPDLLSRFRQRHPGIDIVAIEGSDVEVLDWLAQDAIDIGVVLNPTSPSLILGRDAWMALLPSAHPLARKREIALKALEDEPFILATGGCAVNGLSLMHDAKLALNDIRVTVRDWASACALVREGMGMALVPESTLPEDMRNLRALPLAPKVHRQFGLQCSRAGDASPAVTAFCAHIHAEHRKR